MHNPNARPENADGTGVNNVSDLFLERYLLGELRPADKAMLAARLATDPTLRDRLESLRRDDEAFARTHDAAVLARGARERVRTAGVHARVKANAAGSRGLPRFTGWKPALGGVFMLALAAVPAWRVLTGESSMIVRIEALENTADGAKPLNPLEKTVKTPKASPDRSASESAPQPGAAKDAPLAPAAQAPHPAPGAPKSSRAEAAAPSGTIARADEEFTRLKGLEPGLALFRRTQTGAEPLKPGAAVKPGDVVRIGYRAAGRSFGAIFSVDGHGNVTRHWPLSGDSAARLEAGEALLPGAFELDDAPAYERFYLLTAERAFDLKPLLESLHAAKTPAARGLTVVRFDLLKENGI